MQIIKVHYKVSKPVEHYREVKAAAEEMKQFIMVGRFQGLYNKAFALAHAQVSETPYCFFVVSPDVINEKMFESQVIVNPQIIKAPTYKKIFRHEKGEPLMVPNAIEYEEASMSFPFRKPKRINRYDILDVQYQIKTFFGVKTIQRQLSGIASQIFQCMFDHTQGKNIYFNNDAPVKWWELIGTEKTNGGSSLDRPEPQIFNRVKL